MNIIMLYSLSMKINAYVGLLWLYWSLLVLFCSVSVHWILIKLHRNNPWMVLTIEQMNYHNIKKWIKKSIKLNTSNRRTKRRVAEKNDQKINVRHETPMVYRGISKICGERSVSKLLKGFWLLAWAGHSARKRFKHYLLTKSGLSNQIA